MSDKKLSRKEAKKRAIRMRNVFEDQGSGAQSSYANRPTNKGRGGRG